MMTSKVKITIITITFGVTTPAPPSIGTTAAAPPVVTRDPSETFPVYNDCCKFLCFPQKKIGIYGL